MMENAEPLDERLDIDREQGITLPAGMYGQLTQTAVWAQILAVTNFASAILQLLGMFIVLDRIRLMTRFVAGGSNYILLLLVIFLVFICFTTLIGWHLWNYAARLKSAVMFEDNDELDLAHYYQFRYFKTLGWMVISGLILMLATAVLFVYLQTLLTRPY